MHPSDLECRHVRVTISTFPASNSEVSGSSATCHPSKLIGFSGFKFAASPQHPRVFNILLSSMELELHLHALGLADATAAFSKAWIGRPKSGRTSRSPPAFSKQKMSQPMKKFEDVLGFILHGRSTMARETLHVRVQSAHSVKTVFADEEVLAHKWDVNSQPDFLTAYQIYPKNMPTLNSRKIQIHQPPLGNLLLR